MPANAPTLTVAFGTGGAFTNVSADLILEVDIRRGRQYQNDFLESGTAAVVLNNQSGAFDPSKSSRPSSMNMACTTKVVARRNSRGQASKLG